ncbi:hypothetical protein M430DRAFT_55122 [Amorphotheca resinae ATCC 22711]|uniref:Uncharacterized protein n=1 Tax=Amorphotheca resinae ATCC 22711 TaxID=857342 RepID=A0A2T3BE31_AMORE|nr:hypothetical protein M430DRAFT_55122 [Amorphotheca resinae ATCC 22711]PSS27634.1 hypothetical protein M430DRAFT_55122 [Amorphotheca resinae ATCC 22711]
MDEVAGSKGARGRGGGGCTGAQGRITSHIAPPMLCDGPEPSEPYLLRPHRWFSPSDLRSDAAGTMVEEAGRRDRDREVWKNGRRGAVRMKEDILARGDPLYALNEKVKVRAAQPMKMLLLMLLLFVKVKSVHVPFRRRMRRINYKWVPA